MAQSSVTLSRPEASSASAGARAVRVSEAALRDLFGPASQRRFNVRLWDGTVETSSAPSPDFTLVLRRPGALRRMLLPPSELALGEAYLRDDFNVEGNMEAATALADDIAGRLRSPLVLGRLVARLLSLPGDDVMGVTAGGQRGAAHLAGREHSKRRDAVAVRYHYDVGNNFYSLWLDSRMVYSCAYFETGSEDIDAAQTAKLEHICRKLRLQPGEHLLDIGCGWGGLVMYAAQHYGVHATGITLSEPQAALARKRIAEAGLTDLCQVEVRDYRSLPRKASFDKIVSVGMFEHVGRAQQARYFGEAHRLLKPGGLFLNHGIVTLTPEPGNLVAKAAQKLWGQGEFIKRYVFPDGELMMPHEAVAYAEGAGFETRDVESLREHYALTLRQWVRRLEEHHDEAARLVGEPTYRVWRLYMSGSAHGFASGRIGIVQMLLSRPDSVGKAHLPLTRKDLYIDD